MQRKLGNFERLIWHAGQVNSFNFVTVADLKGVFSADVIRQALDRLQPSYPMLNVCVKQEDGGDSFAAISLPIPLNSKELEYQESWLDEIRYELNLPFDVHGGPLARVLHLSQKDQHKIIITFNHVIADALSGMHFLHQLISVVNELLNNSKNIKINSFRLLPSIEDLQGPGMDATNLASIDNPSLNGAVKRKLTKSGLLTSVIHYQFSIKDTKKIIAICRLNNVSVHSFICSALSATLFELKQDKLDRLMCLSPVNMRPYLSTSVNSDEMGYLLSRVDSCVFNKKNFDVVENAKLINSQIKDFFDLDMHNEILHNMQSIFSLYFSEEDFHKKIQLSAPGILISNIGRVNLDAKLSEITIENMHFALACQGILGNENSMAAAITAFNNQMNINFHYIEPLVTPDEAKLFMNIFLKRIEKIF